VAPMPRARPASALARQEYELVPFEEVRLHPQNRRRGDVPRIVESIRVKGFYGACGRQASSGLFIWGNHRYLAAAEARGLIERARSGEWDATSEEEAAVIESWRGWPERFGGELDAVPTFTIDCDDEMALDILIGDNADSDAATWDRPGLAEQLEEIAERRGSLEGTGFTRPELDSLRSSIETAGAFARPTANRLAERFLVPPFSVLDARQGYWQDRKREWLSLGIRSELGRARNLLKYSEEANERGGPRLGPAPNASTPASDSGNDPQFYWKKQEAERRAGRELSTEEFLSDFYEGPDAYVGGTSIFDPVLCELAYRWWSPEGGSVLDPFAGGSVRGIVASRLGRSYTGIDLSKDQVRANEEQAAGIVRPSDPAPQWVVGDACHSLEGAAGPYDFIFSCPPYYNLERYTDDPADLSNAESWEAFCGALSLAVEASCSQLRPGRFACFVVGNLRAESEPGSLYDLQAATVAAFEHAGLAYYNDAILVTAIGSLALRAARIFRLRKLGRTHQAVLVFLKPPLDEALEACGPIEVADPAEAFGQALER